MELYNQIRDQYGPGEDDRFVELRTNEILKGNKAPWPDEILKKIFSLIDLTTLNTADNDTRAREMTRRVNTFSDHFHDLPNVAAICVYPTLLQTVKSSLDAEGVDIAVVGAGFPSSQTFLSVKLAECELLVEKGADEIDIVISVGAFLEGDLHAVMDELLLIRETTKRVKLKVILETGILSTAENIRLASLMAMEAGADFIKTSTGKTDPAATPEAVYVMLKAIRDYYTKTGRKVGIKPAGGISSVEQATIYYCLVDQILGDEWLYPTLFRLGASRLANALLSEIMQEPVKFF